MGTVTSDFVLIANADTYSADNSGVGGSWGAFGSAGGTGIGVGVDFAMQGTFAIDMKINTGSRKGIVFTPNTPRQLLGREKFFIWWDMPVAGTLLQFDDLDPISEDGARLHVALANGDRISYLARRLSQTTRLNRDGRTGYCMGISHDTQTPGTQPFSQNYYTNPNITLDPRPAWAEIGVTIEVQQNSKGPNFAVDAIHQGTGFFIVGQDTGSQIDQIENAARSLGTGAVNELISNIFEVLCDLTFGENSSGTPSASSALERGKTLIFRPVAGDISYGHKLTFKGTDVNYTYRSCRLFCEAYASGNFGTSLSNAATIEYAATGGNGLTFDSCSLSVMFDGRGSTAPCTFDGCGIDTWSSTVTRVSESIMHLNDQVTVKDCIFRNVAAEILPSTLDTVNGCTTIRCESLNQIQDCTFIAFYPSTDPNVNQDISACVFIVGASGGSANFTTNQTMDWTSKIYFSNLVETGFLRTANEIMRVFVDPGVTVTINVQPGSTTPTVAAVGGGSVVLNIVQTALTITNIVPDSDVVILEQGTTTKLVDVQDIAGTSYLYSYSPQEPNQVVDIAVYRTGYVPYFVYGYTLGNNDSSLPVAQVADRNYLP